MRQKIKQLYSEQNNTVKTLEIQKIKLLEN